MDPEAQDVHAGLEARAAVMRQGLRQVWGDQLPPGPDPLSVLLVDAAAFDDEHGRRRGLVVQGDGVPRAAGAPTALDVSAPLSPAPGPAWRHLAAAVLAVRAQSEEVTLVARDAVARAQCQRTTRRARRELRGAWRAREARPPLRP